MGFRTVTRTAALATLIGACSVPFLSATPKNAPEFAKTEAAAWKDIDRYPEIGGVITATLSVGEKRLNDTTAIYVVVEREFRGIKYVPNTPKTLEHTKSVSDYSIADRCVFTFNPAAHTLPTDTTTIQKYSRSIKTRGRHSWMFPEDLYSDNTTDTFILANPFDSSVAGFVLDESMFKRKQSLDIATLNARTTCSSVLKDAKIIGLSQPTLHDDVGNRKTFDASDKYFAFYVRALQK